MINSPGAYCCSGANFLCPTKVYLLLTVRPSAKSIKQKPKIRLLGIFHNYRRNMGESMRYIALAHILEFAILE